MNLPRPYSLFHLALAAMAALLMTLPARAANITVYANNSTPGDDFTNASGTSTTPSTSGAQLGASGWYYNNVRNNGHVGIRTDIPRSGNGSAWFNGT